MEKQDQIEKYFAYDKKVLITCADTTNLVEKARQVHDLSPTVTAAFGRLLTMTELMAANDEKTHKLTIQVKGNGPIGTMLTTMNHFPEVKGYITNPLVELPVTQEGKIDVAGAVGKQGYLNVIKDIGLKEPYIGMTPIVSGELAEDFANYYGISEQKPSAVALGVLVSKEGVKRSGGYLITPMPDAKEEEISKIESHIFQAGSISKMLETGLSLQEIVRRVTGDEKIQKLGESIFPSYRCDCSKKIMEQALVSIGKEELEQMIEEEQKAELVCHFCHEKYFFSKSELENLLENTKK